MSAKDLAKRLQDLFADFGDEAVCSELIGLVSAKHNYAALVERLRFEDAPELLNDLRGEAADAIVLLTGAARVAPITTENTHETD